MEETYHEPVLVNELIKALHIKNSTDLRRQARYIDATLGSGGHALEIIKNGGRVLGIDADPEMISIAKQRIKKQTGNDFKAYLGNFINIDQIAEEADFLPVEGVVADLGISSLHYKSARGFSFQDPKQILDMRLNPETQGVKASDLLNLLRKDQLIELFSEVITRYDAEKLAEKIIAHRPINTVGDFLLLFPEKYKTPHPATLAFLGLRIAVNSELENLKIFLTKAFSVIDKGGKLVIISFHSGEDKIVKSFFREMTKTDKAYTEGKQPIMPSEAEVDKNPKARSAKMRILIKK